MSENNENLLLFKLKKISTNFEIERQEIIDDLRLEIFGFVEKLLEKEAQMGLTCATFSVDELFCIAGGLQIVMNTVITEDGVFLTNLGEKLYSKFKENNVHRVGWRQPKSILTTDDVTHIRTMIIDHLIKNGLSVTNEYKITVNWE